MCLCITLSFSTPGSHRSCRKRREARHEGSQGMCNDWRAMSSVLVHWPSNRAICLKSLPNALLSFSLLCRGEQEPRVQWGRRAQWDPKGSREGPVQKVFGASQAPRSVHCLNLKTILKEHTNNNQDFPTSGLLCLYCFSIQ